MEPVYGPKDMWDGLAAHLKGIEASLETRPKAIVVVSGHWEAAVPTVQANAHPPLLFDYYGFPEHTYRLTYPAPGAPDLARHIRDLLGDARLRLGRGYRTRLRSRRLRAVPPGLSRGRHSGRTAFAP